MKLKLAGGELGYDVRGQGETLLLLHAFPLSRRMWDPQLVALAGRCRVVRFDVRGFGESPPSDGIVTMERIADDAAGLLDHLDLAQAVVCGLSMGGYAAFALVRRHPDRLRALVLADTRAPADSPEARRGRAELGERVRRGGSAVAAEELIPKLLGETSQAKRPELADHVKELIRANPAAGICDSLAGIAARANSTATLREIAVPTLVLCGDEDRLTPPQEARELAEAIRGARLELISGAGHLASLESPDAFNTALGRFLDRL